MNDRSKSTGAIALVTGGFASAFCLAACCALPVLLAGTGIGMAWLAPLVSFSMPHTGVLTAFSLVALVGSAGLVWKTSTRCEPGSLCATPVFRWAVTVAAAIGLVLLGLSKIYA